MINYSASTLSLYDALSKSYDESFENATLRHVYDEVAWRLVTPLLPTTPSRIVDVGCGTGRWVRRCLALGHTVTGIEPSPGMQRVALEKCPAHNFTLLRVSAEIAEIDAGSVDVVLAMGSIQYMEDPVLIVKKIINWLKPGGLFCLHVDGLLALTLELFRIGRGEEALMRLRDGWGTFKYGSESARMHLFDVRRLMSLVSSAGLQNVEAHGLLILPSSLGREHCTLEVARDLNSYIALEEQLARSPSLADAGKHLMVRGKRSV